MHRPHKACKNIISLFKFICLRKKPKNALCYEQTSPLAVYTYSFGCPKAHALAQFVRSALFFLRPKGAVTKMETFCHSPFLYYIKLCFFIISSKTALFLSSIGVSGSLK